MNALAPLQPLQPRKDAWIGMHEGIVTQDAPLSWVRLEPTLSTPKAPNPASNRPQSPTVGLPSQGDMSQAAGPLAAPTVIQELHTLSALAASKQATSAAVTAAHARFLDNQSAALRQIEEISALLHRIQGQD